MAFEAWRDLMTATVTHEAAAGVDDYGQPTYGVARDYPAYLASRVHMVRTLAGDERVSTVQVYLDRVLPTTPNDRLTLPEGYTPRQPSILSITRLRDEHGDECEVLYT